MKEKKAPTTIITTEMVANDILAQNIENIQPGMQLSLEDKLVKYCYSGAFKFGQQHLLLEIFKKLNVYDDGKNMIVKAIECQMLLLRDNHLFIQDCNFKELNRIQTFRAFGKEFAIGQLIKFTTDNSSKLKILQTKLHEYALSCLKISKKDNDYDFKSQVRKVLLDYYQAHGITHDKILKHMENMNEFYANIQSMIIKVNRRQQYNNKKLLIDVFLCMKQISNDLAVHFSANRNITVQTVSAFCRIRAETINKSIEVINSRINNLTIQTTKDPFYALTTEQVIQAAIEVDDLDTALILVKKLDSLDNLYINPLSHERRAILHIAAISGSSRMIKFLVDQGSKVDCLDSNEHTPLHLAIIDGKLENIETLINCGATLNPKIETKLSLPLNVALSNLRGEKLLEIVKLLVESGASITAKEKSAYPPIVMSATHGHDNVLTYFINEKKIDVEFRLSAQEIRASKTCPSSRTLLHAATHGGHVSTVKLLLELGADPNCEALNIAAQAGHIDIVKELLSDERCDLKRELPTSKSMRRKLNVGDLAVKFAALTKQWTIVLELAQAGASLDYDPGIENSVHIIFAAAAHADSEIFSELLKYASVESINTIDEENGETPLHHAIRVDNCENAILLVEAGADYTIKNPMGWWPVHMAIVEGHLSIVKALKTKGDTTNRRCSQDCKIGISMTDGNHPEKLSNICGFSSLMVAIIGHRTEIVEWLIDSEGEEVNYRVKREDDKPMSGATALSLALKFQAVLTAEFLIKRGANVNQPGIEGLLPLSSWIEERADFAIIELLVNAGAKTTLEDESHTTRRLTTPLEHCFRMTTEKLKAEKQFKAFEFLLSKTNDVSTKQLHKLFEIAYTAETYLETYKRFNFIELLIDAGYDFELILENSQSNIYCRHYLFTIAIIKDKLYSKTIDLLEEIESYNKSIRKGRTKPSPPMIAINYATIALYAIYSKRPDILKALIDHKWIEWNAILNKEIGTTIHSILINEYTRNDKLFIDLLVDIVENCSVNSLNSRDDNKRKSLHILLEHMAEKPLNSCEGLGFVMGSLIEKSSLAFNPKRDYESILALAIQLKYNVDIIKSMLENGSNANEISKDGLHPIQTTLTYQPNNLALISCLVENGAKLNQDNLSEDVLMTLAKEHNSSDQVIKYIRETYKEQRHADQIKVLQPFVDKFNVILKLKDNEMLKIEFSGDALLLTAENLTPIHCAALTKSFTDNLRDIVVGRSDENTTLILGAAATQKLAHANTAGAILDSLNSALHPKKPHTQQSTTKKSTGKKSTKKTIDPAIFFSQKQLANEWKEIEGRWKIDPSSSDTTKKNKGLRKKSSPTKKVEVRQNISASPKNTAQEPTASTHNKKHSKLVFSKMTNSNNLFASKQFKTKLSDDPNDTWTAFAVNKTGQKKIKGGLYKKQNTTTENLQILPVAAAKNECLFLEGLIKWYADIEPKNKESIHDDIQYDNLWISQFVFYNSLFENYRLKCVEAKFTENKISDHFTANDKDARVMRDSIIHYLPKQQQLLDNFNNQFKYLTPLFVRSNDLNSNITVDLSKCEIYSLEKSDFDVVEKIKKQFEKIDCYQKRLTSKQQRLRKAFRLLENHNNGESVINPDAIDYRNIDIFTARAAEACLIRLGELYRHYQALSATEKTLDSEIVDFMQQLSKQIRNITAHQLSDNEKWHYSPLDAKVVKEKLSQAVALSLKVNFLTDEDDSDTIENEKADKTLGQISIIRPKAIRFADLSSLLSSADEMIRNHANTEVQNIAQYNPYARNNYPPQSYPSFFETSNIQPNNDNNNNNNSNYGDNEKSDSAKKPLRAPVKFNPNASEFVFNKK